VNYLGDDTLAAQFRAAKRATRNLEPRMRKAGLTGALIGGAIGLALGAYVTYKRLEENRVVSFLRRDWLESDEAE
jgi:hypothetical protein